MSEVRVEELAWGRDLNSVMDETKSWLFIMTEFEQHWIFLYILRA